MRIGKIIQRFGRVDEDQLAECLSIQEELAGRGLPVRLGRLLVEKGYVDRVGLAEALGEQGRILGLSAEAVDTAVDGFRLGAAEGRTFLRRVGKSWSIRAEHLAEFRGVLGALRSRGIAMGFGEVMVGLGIVPMAVASDLVGPNRTERRGQRRMSA